MEHAGENNSKRLNFIINCDLILFIRYFKKIVHPVYSEYLAYLFLFQISPFFSRRISFLISFVYILMRYCNCHNHQQHRQILYQFSPLMLFSRRHIIDRVFSGPNNSSPLVYAIIACIRINSRDLYCSALNVLD